MNVLRAHRILPPPVATDNLDLAALAPGRAQPLLVDLVEDATGHPVQIPVLALRGTRPGPTLGLTAAVHGNEVNGIHVIHSLFEKLKGRPLRGAVLAAAVVNVPGFHLHQRQYPDGTDLNDIMPGRPDGNVSALYAHRFFERIVRKFDYLVDLHTASTGRHNCLYVRADIDHPVAEQMARLLRPEIILHNTAPDGTLRAAAMDRGIPSVTLEIGNPQRFQPRYVHSSVIGLRRVMAKLGMIHRPHAAPGPVPILCHRSRWLYTDRGGLLEVFPKLVAGIAQGEVIARICDVFGREVAQYHAPEAGVVIGKSVDPVGESGARILHLGIVKGGGGGSPEPAPPSSGGE